MSNIAKSTVQSRTTLPEGVLNGGSSAPLADKYGRQVMLPYTVRELITTAQASVTTGTPTTLIAGIAGTKLDLVFISLQNSSDAAITVTLKDDGTTIRTFTVPVATTNGGVITYDLPIPWPQGTSGGTWNVDGPDVTGTTVTVDALFIKN